VEDETERAWLLEHLRPLAGLEGDAGGAERSESFAAWRRFVEALAERRPLVLAFEDLHWADDALLDFVDELVDWVTGVPLLVACTARPELLERRPGWGGGKRNALTVSLGPLADDDTARVLAGALEQAVLPAETQAELLARAAGNPLYAEQYARMLAERGDQALATLPETVQGIIAARLDSLPPAEKALLQNAAVLGRTFWVGALAAIGGEERTAIDDALRSLVRKEFVRRERRSSVGGETEFVFAHLLVRDVAYGQIPRAERAEKHRLAAEWLEALAPDRSEDRAEMLAHHYLAALELSEAAGIDAAALADPARRALRDAGDRAFALGAYPAAERFYASALDLWPEDDPARASLLFRRARAHYLWAEVGVDLLTEARDALLAIGDKPAAAEAEMLLGDAIWREGRREEGLTHVARARELVAGEQPSKIQALILSNVARYHMLANEGEAAVRVGREALALAERLDLDDIRAHALNNIGTGRIELGDRGGLDDLRASLELALRANSPHDIVRAWINLGSCLHTLGEEVESRRCGEEGASAAARYGYAGGLHWLRGNAAGYHYYSGRWEDAAQAVADVLGEAGSPHYLSSQMLSTRALMRVARGDRAGAEADTRQALDLARPASDPQIFHTVLANSAHSYLELGRQAEAIAVLDELLAIWSEKKRLGFAVIASHEAAWTAWALDRGQDFLAAVGAETIDSKWLHVSRAFARGEFAAAAEVCVGMDVPAVEAFARLRAGQLLAHDGRRREAEPELRRALEFYRGVGATLYVALGEELLAASA
jgi:tetratricopeptide (TPR) repeat protein